jgi:hypothetical protein
MKKVLALTTALLISASLGTAASAAPADHEGVVVPQLAAITEVINLGNNYFNFYIKNLQYPFTPTYYRQAQWSTNDLNEEGQDYAPAGQVAAVFPQAGNSNQASYFYYKNTGKLAPGVTIYGAMKASNDRWYRAGACTFDVNMICR